MTVLVSVIVPTRAGEKHLETNFPSVVEQATLYGNDKVELIVVDDCCDAEVASYINARWPLVNTIRNESCLGFGGSVNKAVKSAKGNLVLILNDDMKLSKGFIEPLTMWFSDSGGVFAVTAKSMIDSEGVKNESISVASIDDDLFKVLQPGLEKDCEPFDKPSTIFHAHGGASMFNREKFLSLGGFDELYHPFYWEDVDLSFRAWKKGWQVIYEPKSELFHHSHSTIGGMRSGDNLDIAYYRNMHLFMMKNFRNEKFFPIYMDRVNRLLAEVDLFDRGVIRRSFYSALERIREIVPDLLSPGKSESGLSLDEIIEKSSLKPVAKTT